MPRAVRATRRARLRRGGGARAATGDRAVARAGAARARSRRSRARAEPARTGARARQVAGRTRAVLRELAELALDREDYAKPNVASPRCRGGARRCVPGDRICARARRTQSARARDAAHTQGDRRAARRRPRVAAGAARAFARTARRRRRRGRARQPRLVRASWPCRQRRAARDRRSVAAGASPARPLARLGAATRVSVPLHADQSELLGRIYDELGDQPRRCRLSARARAQPARARDPRARDRLLAQQGELDSRDRRISGATAARRRASRAT